jgi:hypothetical protein
MDVDLFYKKNNGKDYVKAPCTGNKKALFVGINYTGTRSELKGCINDVRNVSELICSRFGFKNCLYLTDEQSDEDKKPTYKNILSGMKWLVQDAKPCDSLFFYYSGHGGTARDLDGDEIDGYDETILPLDYTKSGQIIDDVIYEHLVSPLPKGCRLTAVFDSCHSGTVLDLPFTYQCDGTVEVIENDIRKGLYKKALSLTDCLTPSNIEKISNELLSMEIDKNQPEFVKKRKHEAEVIQFSGCEDSQTSSESTFNNQRTGAMSNALVTLLKQDKDYSYTELLTEIRQFMKKKKLSQIPQLSTSHPMNMKETFIM